MTSTASKRRVALEQTRKRLSAIVSDQLELMAEHGFKVGDAMVSTIEAEADDTRVRISFTALNRMPTTQPKAAVKRHTSGAQIGNINRRAQALGHGPVITSRREPVDNPAIDEIASRIDAASWRTDQDAASTLITELQRLEQGR